MHLPVRRVPPHHATRGGRGRRPQQRPGPPLNLAVHLAWCAAVAAGAAGIIGVELASPCPPGGPLAFGDCEAVRPFVIGVVAFSAVVYVAALTAVRWWTSSLLARRLADARAARDWYLLAAAIGLGVAPLLTFTTISALR